MNTLFPQLEEGLNRTNGGVTRMNYWKKLAVATVVLYFIVAITAFAATSWRTQSQPIILPRSAWGAPPPTRVIAPRGTGTRLIFHHAAGLPFAATSLSETAAEIMRIRNMHVNGNGWYDIGYHHVIDRAGRIWQGRHDAHIGGHTYGHNVNLGIINLGNYEGLWGVGAQTVTQASFDAMAALSRWLAYRDSLSLPIVYVHSDFNNTACPGRNMRGLIHNNLRQHLSIVMERR